MGLHLPSLTLTLASDLFVKFDSTLFAFPLPLSGADD